MGQQLRPESPPCSLARITWTGCIPSTRSVHMASEHAGARSLQTGLHEKCKNSILPHLSSLRFPAHGGVSCLVCTLDRVVLVFFQFYNLHAGSSMISSRMLIIDSFPFHSSHP